MKNNFNNVKAACARTTGISHERMAIPCQDSVKTSVTEKITCFVVADGAGSRKYSHFGAKAVTKVICRILTAKFRHIARRGHLYTRKLLKGKVLKTLGKLARSMSASDADFASTLMFFACNKNEFIAGHIGDGILALLKRDGSLAVSQDDEKAFANTTSFTTCKNAFEKMRLFRGKMETLDSVFGMTDGAAESLYSRKNHKLSTACEIIAGWLKTSSIQMTTRAMQKSLETVVKTRSHDDCALALAVNCL